MLMCDLNSFIEEAKIEKDLAQRLRAYFRFQNNQTTTLDVTSWMDLIQRMSPTLQNAVALQLAGTWIEQVQAFDGVDEELLISLSFGFHAFTYPPEEQLWACDDLVDSLCSKRRGVILLAKRATVSFRQISLAKGHELLGSEAFCGMRHVHSALTMSYVEMQVIAFDKLSDIIGNFPDAIARLRSLVRAQALRYTVACVIEALQRVRRLVAAEAARGRSATLLELTDAARGVRPKQARGGGLRAGGGDAEGRAAAPVGFAVPSRRLSDLASSPPPAGGLSGGKSMRRSSQASAQLVSPGGTFAAGAAALGSQQLSRAKMLLPLAARRTGSDASDDEADGSEGASSERQVPTMSAELGLWIVRIALPGREWGRRWAAAVVVQRHTRGFLARQENKRIELEALAAGEGLHDAIRRRLLERNPSLASSRPRESFVQGSELDGFADSPHAARAVQAQLARLERVVEQLVAQIGLLALGPPALGVAGLQPGLQGAGGLPSPSVGGGGGGRGSGGGGGTGAATLAASFEAAAILLRRGRPVGLSPLGPGGSAGLLLRAGSAEGSPPQSQPEAQAGAGGDGDGAWEEGLARTADGASVSAPTLGSPEMATAGQQSPAETGLQAAQVGSLAALLDRTPQQPERHSRGGGVHEAALGTGPRDVAAAVSLANSAAESAAVAAQAAADAAANARAAASALGSAVRAAGAARETRREALAQAVASSYAGEGTALDAGGSRSLRRCFSTGALATGPGVDAVDGSPPGGRPSPSAIVVARPPRWTPGGGNKPAAAADASGVNSPAAASSVPLDAAHVVVKMSIP